MTVVVSLNVVTKGDRGLLTEMPRHVISRLLIQVNFPGWSFLPLPRDSKFCFWKLSWRACSNQSLSFQALLTQCRQSLVLQNIKETGCFPCQEGLRDNRSVSIHLKSKHCAGTVLTQARLLADKSSYVYKMDNFMDSFSEPITSWARGRFAEGRFIVCEGFWAGKRSICRAAPSAAGSHLDKESLTLATKKNVTGNKRPNHCLSEETTVGQLVWGLNSAPLAFFF